MTTIMTERIRLIIDTEDVIRRAVQLRKVKSGSGESVSEIVNAILREAFAEEIAELEQHNASRGVSDDAEPEEKQPRKRKGK